MNSAYSHCVNAGSARVPSAQAIAARASLLSGRPWTWAWAGCVRSPLSVRGGEVHGATDSAGWVLLDARGQRALDEQTRASGESATSHLDSGSQVRLLSEPASDLSERARIVRAQILARSHMCAFLRWVEPLYTPVWYADLIADRMTRLRRRRRGQTGPGSLGALLVRVAPQHGKTMLCEEMAPAFFACADPTERSISLCYGRSLSRRNIRAMYNISQRPAYREISMVRVGRVVDEEGGIHTDEAKADIVRYMIDGPRGVVPGPGYYLSVGVRSELTGWSMDSGFCGDLIRTPDEAFSPVHRAAILDRVQSMFFSRMNEHTVFCCAMSPWHPKDISYEIERLAREAGVDMEVLELPARAGPNNALHPDDPRTPGSNEVLDTVRHSEAFYRRMEVFSGRYWKSLYMLTPENFGPKLIPSSAWVEFDPDLLVRRLVTPTHLYVSVDTNGDEGGASNAHITVGVCVAQRSGQGLTRMLWKLEQDAGPWGYAVLRSKLFAIVLRIGRAAQGVCPLSIIIERKALGPALIADLEGARSRLQAEGCRSWHLESERPTQSKRDRAEACEAIIMAGLVCLPACDGPAMPPEAPGPRITQAWTGFHRNAWSAHPNPLPGAHDLVDADSQWIRYAAQKSHIDVPGILAGG